MQHFDGYQKAIQDTLKAELPELLRALDTLYGRDNVEDLTDIDEVRAEALRQIERDWRIEPVWGSV